MILAGGYQLFAADLLVLPWRCPKGALPWLSIGFAEFGGKSVLGSYILSFILFYKFLTLWLLSSINNIYKNLSLQITDWHSLQSLVHVICRQG